MNNLVNEYIKDHDKAWAPSTKKSESARLISILPVLDGNPETLWKTLEDRKIAPYSRVTTWTRVVDFWSWGIEQGKLSGPNPYKNWREKNARLFKNSYERKTPQISFEDAKGRIAQINDEGIRRKAYELLYSGLRYSESYFVNPDVGRVIGKGGKKRDAFLPEIEGPEFKGSYWKFWKVLSNVGLKPHMLRKLKATDLARKGMDLRNICEAMGWSRMETAMCYIAPIKREEMEKYFR